MVINTMNKKRNIVIVEPFSTGFNLIDDVKSRGYRPVAAIAEAPGTEEDRAPYARTYQGE